MNSCGSTGARTHDLSLTVRTLPLSYRATRSYHQHLFTSTLPGYTLPRALQIHPRISYILPRRTYRLNHLSTVVFFMLGAICNRWKIVARPGLEPRAFCWPCEHSTTELPSHPVISTTILHLKPTPVTLIYLFCLYVYFVYFMYQNIVMIIKWG